LSIDEHLLRDEEILASADDKGRTFYATNRRVIKADFSWLNESVDSIPYSKVSSVSEKTKKYYKISILGGFLCFLDLILQTFWLFMLGVLLVLIGVFYKNKYYVLKGMGISDWELKDVDKSEVRRFARMVEDKITQERGE